MSPRSEVGGRERLIRAALKAFADDGIDAVSIRAINRAAGVGPASVHYHFSTKEGLLEAVLLHHGDAVVEAIVNEAQELLDRGQVDSRDVVRSITEPYVDLLRTQRESGLQWVKVIDQLLRRDQASVSDDRATEVRSQVTRLAFPEADSDRINRAMATSVQLLVTQVAQLSESDVAEDEALERTVEDLQFLSNFLAGGLAASLLNEPVAAP